MLNSRYVVSCRVRTARSIRGLTLPPACTRAERRDVEKITTDALDGLGGDLKGKYYPLNNMSDKDQEQLIAVSVHTILSTSNRIPTRWQ